MKWMTYRELFEEVMEIITVENIPILFYGKREGIDYLVYALREDDYADEHLYMLTEIENLESLITLLEGKKSIFKYFDEEYQSNTRVISFKNKNKKGEEKECRVSLSDTCDQYDELKDYHGEGYLLEDMLPEEDIFVSPYQLNKISINQTLELLKNECK